MVLTLASVFGFWSSSRQRLWVTDNLRSTEYLAKTVRICHYAIMKTLTKNPMTSVNISLPSNQRQFVEKKVSKGGYSTVSEYFRELIRQDEQREAEARLESMLLQSLESGEPTPMTKEDWEDVRKEVKRRAVQRNKGKSNR
jgi:antitoxin ParD1/3/4